MTQRWFEVVFGFVYIERAYLNTRCESTVHNSKKRGFSICEDGAMYKIIYDYNAKVEEIESENYKNIPVMNYTKGTHRVVNYCCEKHTNKLKKYLSRHQVKFWIRHMDIYKGEEKNIFHDH